MWYSAYRFLSSSGGLYSAATASLFTAKQGGSQGQGWTTPLDFTQTNLQIEKQIPYPALVRRIGFSFLTPTLDGDKVVLSDLLAVNWKRMGTSDHYLGLLRDWLALPDFAAAVAEGVPAAGPAASVERRWVQSGCRMRDLLIPFELEAGGSFSVDLIPRTGGVQSATATAHDAIIMCRLEVEPLDQA
jgi:hypothetical protein